MPEPTVSALILARDEAHNLADCVQALRWVDEVVIVVDPASRDATEAEARRLGDRVLVHPFDDFARQRNRALDLARGDWVFAVDADERSNEHQGREIRERLREPRSPYVGYRVPIRSVILGRPFAYSGTQHDRPLRLFRRGAGRWTGMVHERPDVRGPIGILDEPLQHCTIPNMQVFLKKIDEYTSLDAAERVRRGEPVHVVDLAFAPLLTFLKLYLYKQGCRDGLEGFVFCALSGVSVGVRHWKQRELATARGGEAA